MEQRTLELNIISAQNLKKVKNFGHQSCYAVAYISSRDKKASKVDKAGGVNPTWNEKLTVTCDERLLQRGKSHITVEIYSHGTFGNIGNKLVGTSKIPLLEIGKQVAASAPPKLLSLEVHRRSDKVQGVLNVSIKVGEKRYIAEKGHFGRPLLGFSENYRRQQLQQEAVSMGYPQFHPQVGSPRSYSGSMTLQKVSHQARLATADSASRSPMSSSSNVSKTDESAVTIYPTSGPLSAQFSQQYGSQHYGTQAYLSSAQVTAPRRYQKVHHAKTTRRQSDHARCCSDNTGGRGTRSMGLLEGVTDIF